MWSLRSSLHGRVLPPQTCSHKVMQKWQESESVSERKNVCIQYPAEWLQTKREFTQYEGTNVDTHNLSVVYQQRDIYLCPESSSTSSGEVSVKAGKYLLRKHVSNLLESFETVSHWTNRRVSFDHCCTSTFCTICLYMCCSMTETKWSILEVTLRGTDMLK